MYYLDFETRNTVTDIKEVGAYRYAEDAVILMAAVARGDEEPLLWVNPAFGKSDPGAKELIQEMLSARESPIVAHNAEFEAAHVHLLPFVGADSVAISRWVCTAGMARKAGLHPSLEGVCEDLRLQQAKFAEGKALIQKYSCQDIPPGGDWGRFCEYCRQDVRAERAVFKALTPFIPTGVSLKAWQFTLRMNRRGVPVNIPALKKAEALVSEETEKHATRFRELTGLKHTQREAVKEWLLWRGVILGNMQGDTLGKVETDDPEVREAVDLYMRLSFAATAKIRTMLACACKDSRVRGTLLYHGAGTGRWSGKLIQPQNFRKSTVEDTEGAYAAIQQGISLEDLELLYGPPLEVIASCIRHFIDSGSPLFDGDYSAIEARVLNWLAGQYDVVADFRAGRDVYKHMAAFIHRKKVEDVTGWERQLGKAAVLGAGYGMGPDKFRETCASWGIDIDDQMAERAITAYREKHSKVVQLWRDYDMAAKKAVKNPGECFEVRGIRFKTQKYAGIEYLFIQLPSKRALAYPHPAISSVLWVNKDSDVAPGKKFREYTQTPGGWLAGGELIPLDSASERAELSYYGAIPGKALWGRIGLYGGKIVENIVQGIAADLMTEGGCSAEAAGYEVFLVVHDQALAPKRGDLRTFEKALTFLPAWAEGLPLAAEASETKYYTK